MLEWDRLLCRKTFVERLEGPKSWKQYPVDDFDMDYEEVITSRMFRFLQDKAQLFPLVKGRSLRTRLTHSIEVASIGDQMGRMVGKSKKAEEMLKFGEKGSDYAMAFSSILSTAGLLHDLGNPPFGHFGEASIGYWFDKCFSENHLCCGGRPVGQMLNEQMKMDLINFDGNAQAVHVLLKSGLVDDIENVNVTYATINTLVKYPQASHLVVRKDPDVRKHKFGYFLADEKKYNLVRDEVGLSGISRYPLTFLLEAADDIAYSLSDIEDSFNNRTVATHDLVRYFENYVASMPEPETEEENMQQFAILDIVGKLKKGIDGTEGYDERSYALKSWFAYVKKWLIYATVHSFFNNYEAIMDGSYSHELLADSWYGSTIKMLKKACVDLVLRKEDMLRVELSGNRVITSLLDTFVPVVAHWGTEKGTNAMTSVEVKFLDFLPERDKREYLAARTGDEAYDLYLRLMIVTDYISTMTDTIASDTYHLIYGI